LKRSIQDGATHHALARRTPRAAARGPAKEREVAHAAAVEMQHVEDRGTLGGSVRGTRAPGGEPAGSAEKSRRPSTARCTSSPSRTTLRRFGARRAAHAPQPRTVIAVRP
jgi:hypothetical protein